ncbi:MAG: hypothetical protein JOZ39_11590 [Chloroflexi bacterium]|nr:hypothetical protein [Chloroflexota bacterium]
MIPILGVLLGLMLIVPNAFAADQRDPGSSAGGAGSAHAERHTDVFVGTATTGAGSALPVDINPSDITVRADGAIGLGYIYKASGPAYGDEAGTFDYVEHGYLYFMNPADPTTYAGSSFNSGVFTLHAKHDGKDGTVVISDTQPSAYQHGVKTTHVGNSAALKEIEKRLGLHQAGDDVTYGYFTFTDKYGTFTGYASPDFRQFSIRITF